MTMTVEEAIAAARVASALPDGDPSRLEWTQGMTAAKVLADEVERLRAEQALRKAIADDTVSRFTGDPARHRPVKIPLIRAEGVR